MKIEYPIETERLIIRTFRPDDYRDLFEYLSKEEVVHFEPYDPFTFEGCRIEAIRRSQTEEFLAVVLKKTDKVIGNLYFGKRDFDAYELGFVFNSTQWHHGYAFESASALIGKAFKLGIARRIVAHADPENPPSWKLMERLGMRREGHELKNIWFIKDAAGNPLWRDTYKYALLKEEMKNPE